MNILFFLTPKSEVTYIYDTDSLRQALEKMENCSYTAVPIISKNNGSYVGTLTEGDLLWSIKRGDSLSLKKAEDISVMDIKRHRHNEPVDVDVDMEDLLNKAINQNFVPVIDGEECFIGLITRKDLIQYLCRKLVSEEAEACSMSIAGSMANHE